jgi:hypothetical protein
MSPERQSAQLAVEEAIGKLRDVVAAEDPEAHDPDEILTAWVVVASRTSFHDDAQTTAVSLYMPDTMPDWQVVGLLRFGEQMYHDSGSSFT